MVGLIEASGPQVWVAVYMDSIEGHRDSMVALPAGDRSTGHAPGLDLAAG